MTSFEHSNSSARDSIRYLHKTKDKPKKPNPYNGRNYLSYDRYLDALDRYRIAMKIYIENGGEV